MHDESDWIVQVRFSQSLSIVFLLVPKMPIVYPSNLRLFVTLLLFIRIKIKPITGITIINTPIIIPMAGGCPRPRVFCLRGKEVMDMREGGGSGFDFEFFKEIADVSVDGADADAEDDGDFAVSFSLRNPPKNFAFTTSQAKLEKMMPRWKGLVLSLLEMRRFGHGGAQADAQLQCFGDALIPRRSSRACEKKRDVPAHVPLQARPSASEKNAETRPNLGVCPALPFP